jgi:hypothetical protein
MIRIARASAGAYRYVPAMRRTTLVQFFGWIAGGCLVFVLPGSIRGDNSSSATLPLVTNVLQFDCLAEHSQPPAFTMQLEGAVRWADADGRLLA